MAEEHKDEHGGESHGGGSHGGGHGGGHGGHGGAHEEHEGAPEWLISFADNVALMMGFFVILLAMNMGPKGTPVQGGEPDESNNATGSHAADIIISIREGFNNPVDLRSTRPEDQPLIRRILERKGGLGKADAPTGRYEQVQAIPPTDFKNVTGVVQFDDRSAVLAPGSRGTIADVAARVKGQRWIIEVRGHASPFESMRNVARAMDLSYQRALAVAQALNEAGVAWENLRVVACGDTDRVVPRTYDPVEDRGNQRAEIVLTNEVVQPDPYTMPADTKEPGANAPPSNTPASKPAAHTEPAEHGGGH